jgi:integrase
MEQSGDIHLLMTQLGHTSTTTAALYTNPEQEKAKKAAKKPVREEPTIVKRIKKGEDSPFYFEST